MNVRDQFLDYFYMKVRRRRVPGYKNGVIDDLIDLAHHLLCRQGGLWWRDLSPEEQQGWLNAPWVPALLPKLRVRQDLHDPRPNVDV